MAYRVAKLLTAVIKTPRCPSPDSPVILLRLGYKASDLFSIAVQHHNNTMRTRRFTKRRIKQYAALTLVTFLFSTILPAFAIPTLPVAGTPTQADAHPFFSIDGRILLCTRNGYQWVKIETLQNQSNAVENQRGRNRHREQQPKCPFCFLGENEDDETDLFTANTFDRIHTDHQNGAITSSGLYTTPPIAGHPIRAPPPHSHS